MVWWQSWMRRRKGTIWHLGVNAMLYHSNFSLFSPSSLLWFSAFQKTFSTELEQFTCLYSGIFSSMRWMSRRTRSSTAASSPSNSTTSPSKPPLAFPSWEYISLGPLSTSLQEAVGGSWREVVRFNSVLVLRTVDLRDPFAPSFTVAAIPSVVNLSTSEDNVICHFEIGKKLETQTSVCMEKSRDSRGWCWHAATAINCCHYSPRQNICGRQKIILRPNTMQLCVFCFF